MTIYCNQWRAPEQPHHIKCFYRVIAQETPAYKGKPICVNTHKTSMVCCRESEYSIKISAEISQELPEGGFEPMGAPIPAMQRVSEATISLNANIEAMSQSLADGNRKIKDFGNAIATTWNKSFDSNVEPETFQRNIRGSWSMGFTPPNTPIRPLDRISEVHFPPEGLESLNPDDCNKFTANEFGNCKNLHWCFRVFGMELKCQQTRKETVPKTLKEHRRLEVE